MAQEIAKEFTTEELEEFLAGDLDGVRADPRFQERLRRELWAMLQQRSSGGANDRLD